jgi:hypothetical protein
MGYKIMPFYGFMGSSGVTDIRKGKDTDKSFELVAATISRTCKNLYPGVNVFPPIKSWTYKEMFTAWLFGVVGGSVGEVHVCTHGGASLLSLAYEFEDGARIQERAKKFNNLAKKIGNKKAALRALDEEDGLWTGTLSVFPDDADNWRLKATKLIQGNMDEKGYVHIWGCYAGAATAGLSYADDPVLDAYFRRFRLRKPNPGVAKDIAMALKVPVTAAQVLPNKAEGGLEFWHRKSNGVPERTGKRDKKAPMWLWPDKNSKWVTYKPDGTLSDKIRLFSSEWEPKDVASGKLPDFLNQLYGK